MCMVEKQMYNPETMISSLDLTVFSSGEEVGDCLPGAVFCHVMHCRRSVVEDVESYCLFGNTLSLDLARDVNGFGREVQTAVISQLSAH